MIAFCFVAFACCEAFAVRESAPRLAVPNSRTEGRKKGRIPPREGLATHALCALQMLFFPRWELHPEKTVTHRFTLEQAPEAYRVMDAGQCGKVVIEFPE